jgi:hypothetical protein
MDGYSVEEAAEVLGIPQGRVWELIARGVLGGASEGRSDMRVFLKPPSGGGSQTAGEGSGSRANGGTHVEASPFRELLTEFRNLTERYGQALLALGEARGEVAALRSRVEVLEARMDLRPPLRAASTVAWELPDRYASQPAGAESTTEAEPAPLTEEAEPMPEPHPPAEPSAEAAPEAEPSEAGPATTAEPDAVAEEPVAEVTVVVHAEPAAADEGVVQEPEPPKRRITGGRAAVAGLAEALARAEDPTLADLPGAREAGEALAALHRDVASTADHEGEAAAHEPEPPELEPEPAEPAPAEPEPVAEEIQAAFATPIELPEEPTPQIPEPQAPDAELPTVELPTSQAVTEPPTPDVLAAEEPSPAPAEPASPYTTEVVEPDWFADGDFSWLDAGTAEGAAPEPAEPAQPEQVEPAEAPEDVEPPELEAEHIEAAEEGASVEAIQDAFSEPPTEPANPWPAQDRGGIATGDAIGFNLFREPPGVREPPPAEVPASTSAEEELLWFGDEFEAADLEMETPGWRAAGPAPAEPAPATVAPEVLDEEIERLADDEGWDETEVDAIRSYLGRADAGRTEDQEEASSPPQSTAPEPPDATEAQAGETDASDRTAAPLPDQDWLRGRRGPAAGAYRRLRRLFQG